MHQQPSHGSQDNDCPSDCLKNVAIDDADETEAQQERARNIKTIRNCLRRDNSSESPMPGPVYHERRGLPPNSVGVIEGRVLANR